MTLLVALAALEQEWRNRATYLREHCFDKREDGEAEGVKSCADDLAALRVRFEGARERCSAKPSAVMCELARGHEGMHQWSDRARGAKVALSWPDPEPVKETR